MSDILFHAHSGLRYLVLLAAAVTLGYAAFGALKRRPLGRVGRRLGAAFTGVLDLQVLLGIVLVFMRPWFPALIGHITLMLLAAVTAHGTSIVNRRRPPEERSHTILAVGTAITVLIVVAGIMAIGRSIL